MLTRAHGLPLIEQRTGATLVRRFYELRLPWGFLGITLLAAAAGVAALTGFWAAHRKQGRGRSQPGAE